VLSVAICDHYNHVSRILSDEPLINPEYSKQNVLLLGPTGVGKTYLIKNIAKLIGVPFVKADATKFSETGYVGSDVEDLVRDLVKAADGNVELAQYGIIFVDEIDKIANEAGMGGRDISGRGVQINFLKLMEETEVNLFSSSDMMAQMQAVMEMQRGKKPKRRSINTKNILFIVSGAFDKLAESIKKRMTQNELGFGATMNGNDEDVSSFLRYAETADFVKYGFEPEFIGRVPVRVACKSLTAKDLEYILTKSEGSILNQYYDDFSGYGIQLNIKEGVIAKIAEAASKEGTGARGLMTVLERLFREFKFELPSSPITDFDVTTEMMEDTTAYLRKLKQENTHLQEDLWLKEIERFSTDFEEQYGFRMKFKESAKKALIKEAMETDCSMRALCTEKFKDFEHGFLIIFNQTGQKTFNIGKLAVLHPDREISKWVVRSVDNKKS